MPSKIALVGIPIETVPLQDEGYGYNICAHIPGLTARVRELILDKAKKQGIFIEDLKEVYLGEHYEVGYNIDRLSGIPVELRNTVKAVDIKKLEEARKQLLEKSKGYDLIVAVGASHLGAIILYDDNDSVARLDYHTDFKDKENLVYGFNSYMDWVKQNIRNLDITNYFTKPANDDPIFGRLASDTNGKHYTFANHFDIDVDCFDLRYFIQNVFKHEKGSSKVTPEIVLSMIREAKPNKLGIWEYRPSRDSNNAGLDFIVNSITAATSN